MQTRNCIASGYFISAENVFCGCQLKTAHIVLPWQLLYATVELEFEQRGEDFRRSELRLKRLNQLIELRGLVCLQAVQHSALWVAQPLVGGVIKQRCSTGTVGFNAESCLRFHFEFELDGRGKL